MDAEPRETASTTIALLLRHVQKQGGDWAVAEVLSRAGVEQSASSLREPGTWVGYDTRIRLFQAATDVLGNPDTMFTVGLSAVLGGVQPLLVQLLGLLASPSAVYRQLPRMVPKFTTTSTIDGIEVATTTATIRYRLNDGYRPSRLDCQFARGLFSAVPTIFGRAPAEVGHTECQSDGFPECRYDISWSARPSWRQRRFRRPLADASLAALRDRIREVQFAAADLVGSVDLDEMLARIVDRSASAVLAPAYLLVVEAEGTGAPMIRQRGLSDERAAELGERMRRGDDLGERALVVDIVSSRRAHGHLAALFSRGHTWMDGDRALLEAYAGHAASALDLFTALEESRREGHRTAALLHFAHELAACESTVAVAGVVADALPSIVGCDGAGILLWDAELGELHPIAASGFEAPQRTLFLQSAIPLDQTPEFLGLFARYETVVLTREDASPPVAALLLGIGAQTAVAVPLLAGDTLMGIAAVAWSTPVVCRALDEATVRIEGVSNQGATAMQRASLMAVVRHQSQHDSLTGLPNRVLFASELDRALRTSPTGTSTAVMFCDLDNFKRVNDLLGHRAGDELLRQVAARLHTQVGDDDTIGRLGGDEFAVIATELTGETGAIDLARRLVDCLNPPFHLAGQDVRISASVGVAVHTGTGGHGEQLLESADTAMYIAKRTGRNQVSVAGHTRQDDASISLVAELGRALEQREMRLHFQPIVDLSPGHGGSVVGAEALIRWEHPRLGLLAPAAFLPLAEETGLITELDLWTVAAACAAAVDWPATGGILPSVAVNLDAATLLDTRLVQTIRAALTGTGLAPERLILEVVESRALIDLPGVVERLVDLRRMGIRISLDDFGTGFSTLAWLDNLPVDQIKIDRTFITNLPNPSSVALVEGILALADKLGIEVVAEGVETEEQWAALRRAHCRLAQGYFFGRPDPVFPDAPAGSVVQVRATL